MEFIIETPTAIRIAFTKKNNNERKYLIVMTVTEKEQKLKMNIHIYLWPDEWRVQNWREAEINWNSAAKNQPKYQIGRV